MMNLPRRFPGHRIEQVQNLAECDGTLSDGINNILFSGSGERQCFGLRTADGGAADVHGMHVGVQ